MLTQKAKHKTSQICKIYVHRALQKALDKGAGLNLDIIACIGAVI